MADSKNNDSEHGDDPRRKAGEPPEGEQPEPTESSEADQGNPPDTAQQRRRVPGLHGFDPSQWPDATI
jgi:hypothetical protein